MSLSILLLASVAGLLLVVASWVHYLAMIPREKVPIHPHKHSTVMIVGILAVAGSFAAGIAQGQGPTVWAWLLGGSTVGLGLFFFYLLRQAPTPDKPIKTAVGQPLPSIIAVDAQGNTHDSKDWRGQRVLFKFFRGHW